MNRILALAIIIALGAGCAQAKKAYCTDPTSHKRISCKASTATPAAPSPMAASTPMANSPTTTTAPAKKPSMMSSFMKPKPAPRSTEQMASPAMATGGAPHCTKGKVCGHSCVAVAKVCHKPS